MGFCKDDVYVILNEDKYSVDDKIEKLKELKNRISEEIDQEIDILRGKIIYCPYCKKSYLKKFWEDVYKEEEISPYWSIEDEEKYLSERIATQYRVCPCGHRVLK